MKNGKKKASVKRKELRKKLNSKKLLVFPGAYNALISLLIERKKFDGVYISGAVLSNNLAWPDIGKTSLDYVGTMGEQINQSTQLPCLIDADTGFKSPFETVRYLEKKGLCGCHLEDQISQKKCGHLDGKKLISKKAMVKKVTQAYKGRKDKNFLIIARTDANTVESLDKAIDRAKAYVDAGADMIFPEALKNEKEFEIFRKHISVPLLANMTEFGKSKLLSQTQLKNLGYNIVIYPVTSMRLALKAVESGLDSIKKNKTQKKILKQMQTRNELYKLLNYKGGPS